MEISRDTRLRRAGEAGSTLALPLGSFGRGKTSLKKKREKERKGGGEGGKVKAVGINTHSAPLVWAASQTGAEGAGDEQ